MKRENTEPLKTVLTIVSGCLVIFLFKHNYWLVYTALLVGCASLLSTRLSTLIDWAWMKLAHVLSFIMPDILLTLVFFLVLFPLSVLSKFFKKNDQLLLSHKTKSTFISVNKTFNKQSFEKPW